MKEKTVKPYRKIANAIKEYYPEAAEASDCIFELLSQNEELRNQIRLLMQKIMELERFKKEHSPSVQRTRSPRG